MWFPLKEAGRVYNNQVISTTGFETQGRYNLIVNSSSEIRLLEYPAASRGVTQ